MEESVHLVGYYDGDWNNSYIVLMNIGDKVSKIRAKFYDDSGVAVGNVESEVVPHGTSRIFIGKINEIKKKKGLVIVECDPAIKAEYRWRDSPSPIRAITQLTEGKIPFLSEGRSMFISYAMKHENDELYNLISRFIKGLKFKVLSASETGRADLPPGIQIKDMIRLSDSLLAILTKDVKSESKGKQVYYPSHNVVDEIGQASDKEVIMLVEEGTEVPSNLQTRATYLSFSRKKMGDLTVNLLEAMQKQGLI